MILQLVGARNEFPELSAEKIRPGPNFFCNIHKPPRIKY